MCHGYGSMSSYCVLHTKDFQATSCPGENHVIPSGIWRHACNFICHPQKCHCYGCDNILTHFTLNEGVLLEVSRSKTKTKILTVHPCFVCCYFKFRNKQDQKILFSPVCSQWTAEDPAIGVKSTSQ